MNNEFLRIVLLHILLCPYILLFEIQQASDMPGLSFHYHIVAQSRQL